MLYITIYVVLHDGHNLGSLEIILRYRLGLCQASNALGMSQIIQSL